MVLVIIKQTLSQLCSNLIIYQTTIENKQKEKPNQIKKREENLSTCLCFKLSNFSFLCDELSSYENQNYINKVFLSFLYLNSTKPRKEKPIYANSYFPLVIFSSSFLEKWFKERFQASLVSKLNMLNQINV